MAVTLGFDCVQKPEHSNRDASHGIEPCVCREPVDSLAWDAKLQWYASGLTPQERQVARANGGLFIRHNVTLTGLLFDSRGQLCFIASSTHRDLFRVDTGSLRGLATALDYHFQYQAPYGRICNEVCTLLTTASGRARLKYITVLDDPSGLPRRPNSGEFDPPSFGDGTGTATERELLLFSENVFTRENGVIARVENLQPSPRRLAATRAYRMARFHYGYPAMVSHCSPIDFRMNFDRQPVPLGLGGTSAVIDTDYMEFLKARNPRHGHLFGDIPDSDGEYSSTDSDGNVAYGVLDPEGPGSVGMATTRSGSIGVAALARFWNSRTAAHRAHLKFHPAPEDHTRTLVMGEVQSELGNFSARRLEFDVDDARNGH